LLRAFNHLHHLGSQPTRLFSALSHADADTESRADDVPTMCLEVFAFAAGDEAEYEEESLPNTGESHGIASQTPLSASTSANDHVGNQGFAIASRSPPPSSTSAPADGGNQASSVASQTPPHSSRSPPADVGDQASANAPRTPPTVSTTAPAEVGHQGFASVFSDVASCLAPGRNSSSFEPPPCGACVVLISGGRSARSCPLCAGSRSPVPD
jgi:hypothetical protein